jgi:uroporphyrinogen-III synthase
MAAARAHGTVALLSAPGTLAGVDRLLHRAGVDLLRIETLSAVATDPRRWRGRVRRAPPPDTVIATSRAGVTTGVAPWLRSEGANRPSIEYWAVGPRTAQSLRLLGLRRVRSPRRPGTPALTDALERTVPRTILYFRSSTAGPTFAQALRRRGHRVTEVTSYRLATTAALTLPTRRALALATVWVATSPSSLRALRSGLSPSWYARRVASVRLVVLGERWRQEAAAHGFRHISVAVRPTPIPFTRHLLRELRAGRA